MQLLQKLIIIVNKLSWMLHIRKVQILLSMYNNYKKSNDYKKKKFIYNYLLYLIYIYENLYHVKLFYLYSGSITVAVNIKYILF